MVPSSDVVRVPNLQVKTKTKSGTSSTAAWEPNDAARGSLSPKRFASSLVRLPTSYVVRQQKMQVITEIHAGQVWPIYLSQIKQTNEAQVQNITYSKKNHLVSLYVV